MSGAAGAGGPLSSARQLGDHLRVRPHEPDEHERDEADPRRDQPRDGQRRRRRPRARRTAGRTRPARGSRRTRCRTARRRSRARRLAGGYMSPAAVRISSAVPLAAPVSANPRITSGADPRFVASAVSEQPRGREQIAAGDDRPAPDPVHQPPGGHRREPGGDEEDRGPEPEQPLDPGDEHERERRHRGDELQHARVHRHRDGEQQRVAADRDVAPQAGGPTVTRRAA